MPDDIGAGPEDIGADGVRIGELSRRAGVSGHLLRVWERRYGLLQPSRTPGGQRLYSPADERRLRRMQASLAGGLAPAEAASAALASAALDEERGPGPGAQPGGPEQPCGPEQPGGLAEAAAALGACLVAFDGPAAQSMLDGLLARYTVEAVLRDIVVPCLRGIGQRWAAGTVTVGAEHFATNLLRARLAVLAQDWGQGVGPRAVLACVPGDQHDLALLIFGIVLHRNGWRVEYLGCNTPVADVGTAVTATAADLAVIVATMPALLVRAASSLAELAAAAPLVLAGPGASRAAADAAGAGLLTGDPVTAAQTLAAPAAPSSRAGSPGSPIGLLRACAGQGCRTTLMQPSVLARKISYPCAASSRGRRCVARSRTPSGSVLSVTMGMMSSIQRLTWAWPIRSWMPRSNISIRGIGSASPPYTPLTDTVPPRRTALIAVCSASRRSRPASSVSLRATGPGSSPVARCAAAVIRPAPGTGGRGPPCRPRR